MPLWILTKKTIDELLYEKIGVGGYIELESVIAGGDGIDRIELGSENEAFFLHNSISNFHSVVPTSSNIL